MAPSLEYTLTNKLLIYSVKSAQDRHTLAKTLNPTRYYRQLSENNNIYIDNITETRQMQHLKFCYV